MFSAVPFLACALLAQGGLASLCDPAYATALGRGQALLAADDAAGAIVALNDALARDPSGFHALVSLAEAWNRFGAERTPEAAAEAFTRALGHAQCLAEAYPARPEGPAWAAASYGNLTQRGSPGERVAMARHVAEEAREALRRDPDHVPALVALAIYERELSGLGFFARMAARAFLGGLEETSFESALRLLRRALELEPDSLIAHHELALTLLAAGEGREAETWRELRSVVERLPRGRPEIVRQLDAAARLARRREGGGGG